MKELKHVVLERYEFQNQGKAISISLFCIAASLKSQNEVFQQKEVFLYFLVLAKERYLENNTKNIKRIQFLGLFHNFYGKKVIYDVFSAFLKSR